MIHGPFSNFRMVLNRKMSYRIFEPVMTHGSCVFCFDKKAPIYTENLVQASSVMTFQVPVSTFPHVETYAPGKMLTNRGRIKYRIVLLLQNI